MGSDLPIYSRREEFLPKFRGHVTISMCVAILVLAVAED